MNPQDFVRKWSGVTGNERKLYQQHFLDLWELVDHPKSAELDPSGTWYAFAAAADLVQKRDAWLNPPGATEAQLNKRTLTNLYNERPTWLHLAHQRLDEAVAAAYGWPADLEDEEILARLLALNLERAEAGA